MVCSLYVIISSPFHRRCISWLPPVLHWVNCRQINLGIYERNSELVWDSAEYPNPQTCTSPLQRPIESPTGSPIRKSILQTIWVGIPDGLSPLSTKPLSLVSAIANSVLSWGLIHESWRRRLLFSLYEFFITSTRAPSYRSVKHATVWTKRKQARRRAHLIKTTFLYLLWTSYHEHNSNSAEDYLNDQWVTSRFRRECTRPNRLFTNNLSELNHHGNQ